MKVIFKPDFGGAGGAIPWMPAAAACLVMLIGCDRPTDERPPRFRVIGTISYNGTAPAGALVTFWPLPLAANNWRTVKPMAVVEADGSFEPNTCRDKDGAVPGEYAVTVTWSPSPSIPDLFEGRYDSPETPVATVTVLADTNYLPPIELSGPPVDALPAEKSGAPSTE